MPGRVRHRRFGSNFSLPKSFCSGSDSEKSLDDGLGDRHDIGYRDQHPFGNHYPLETVGSEGSLPNCGWHEPSFHAAYGGGDESGGLWNDGSSCDYSRRFALHLGRWIPRGLALQLLAVEKTRQMLSLMMLSVAGNSFFPCPFLNVASNLKK